MTGEKILIVDDEIEFAETCAECLDMRGFDTRAVSDARAAMDLLGSEWQPDVVLLDLKMPDINGLEALSLIKQHDPAIEVIIITAFGSTASGIEGMQKGLFDYLMKPVEVEELVEKIELALGKRRASRQD